MSDRLAGKTGLVSGASSGLGRSAALAMAREGAHMFVAARRADRLGALVDEIDAAGGTAEAVEMDVADAASVARAFDTIAAASDRLDLLVNSAGIGKAVPFLDGTDADFDAHFDVNVKGLWRVTQQFAALAARRGHGGAIVNIASMLGLGVHPGQTLYCATKAAVLHMTRAIAVELQSRGIRANCACPGYFHSEMTADFAASDAGQTYIRRTPAKRYADAAELDGAIVHLLSDEASFTTGAHISVDGAHAARLV
ncbi:MAG: SDR family oxidoreductase [Pseudomonadota bacterium]